MGPLSDYPAALPNQLYVSSALTAPGLREGLEHMGRARARGEGFHLCSHRESSTLGTDLSTWLLEGPPPIYLLTTPHLHSVRKPLVSQGEFGKNCTLVCPWDMVGGGGGA